MALRPPTTVVLLSSPCRVALTLLAAAVLSVALAAPAVAQGATTTSTAPSTTVPPTTTTSVPPPVSTTTPTTIGTGPTTTVGTTTTTTPSGPPTTLVDPAKLSGLLTSLNSDLARMGAIQAFLQAKAAAVAGAPAASAAGASAAATTAVGAANAALFRAAADELAAAAAKKSAQHSLALARDRLNVLALAYYVHADIAVSPPSAIAKDGPGSDRSVILALLLPQERDDLAHARRAVTKAGKDQVAAKARADRMVAAQAAATQAAAVEAAAVLLLATTTTTTTSSVPSTSVPGSGTAGAPPASGRPPSPYGSAGLSILGPPALTPAELAAWFASTGHQAAVTVPFATLTDFYGASGVTYGVRDDIAFTQSIIETGYFGFPAGGQVATADNNFAGIGACDSCHGGNGFPDAKSGVAAQLQLLHNYATSPPLPGPLPLTAGPTGCCPTWMSLTGVWATNPSYGYSILSLYKHILEWVLARRTANAGL